jgi:acetyl-CoA acetyltransferase
MSDVYIVEAVRTPVGKYSSLAGVRADHLGAHVLNALITRAGIRPTDVMTSSSAASPRWANNRPTSPVPRCWGRLAGDHPRPDD